MDVNLYLNNYFQGTKNPSLKAMNYFMEELNHPEKDLKCIHIAGTNGKGSCTEMMSAILENNNYKVGKFLSPHLIKYNERISINGINITDKKLEELINRLEPLVEKYNSQNEINITLFELETTMAILYFKENNCDFCVFEVGLGGRYDCTNVINPIVSIINSIGYDHMNLLGNSLKEIAYQKAGIIKENSNTVFVKQENDVNNVIIKTCEEKNNNLTLIDKNDFSNYSFNLNYQIFDYKNYKNLEINLKGYAQIFNTALCLETLEILKQKYIFSDEKIRKVLKNIVHHARFEKIYENPTIIYDGGHNEPAIKNLKNSIRMYYKENKKVFIISILKTKDYKKVLELLIKDNREDTFIFTSGNDIERYVSKEKLFEEASKYENKNLFKFELNEALAFSINNYKDSTIFTIGTFYIYGDVISFLTN